MTEDFEPQYWEAGDVVCDILDNESLTPEQRRDAIRKLVDESVRDAIAEYLGDSDVSIDFRMGGSPTVSLTVFTPDSETLAERTVDLGDLLFAMTREWLDSCEPMEDLANALLQTYMDWRKERLTEGAQIPEPAVDEFNDPIKREELVSPEGKQ